MLESAPYSLEELKEHVAHLPPEDSTFLCLFLFIYKIYSFVVDSVPPGELVPCRSVY